MTEIQFLIDLMVNYKLLPKVKERMLQRIAEVSVPANIRAYEQTRPLTQAQAQAMSTQKLLEKYPDLDPHNPVIQALGEPGGIDAPTPKAINRAIIPPKEQEIVMPNGSSIKGPRKW